MTKLQAVELCGSERFIERLSAQVHDDRVRTMVALGVMAKTDARASALISELWNGPVFVRRLVLKSCQGSRDGAQVLLGLADGSRLVRGQARKLVALCCNDAQATQALIQAFSTGWHLWLAQQLRQAGRTGPIDALADHIAQGPEHRLLAEVVPLCSDAGLLRHLPRALSQPTSAFFARFALHHPQRFAEAAQAELAKGPLLGPWKLAVTSALHELSVRTPDAAVQLLHARLRHGEGLPPDVIRPLSERKPNELVALCESHKLALPHELFASKVRRLQPASLRYLVTMCRQSLGNPRHFFRKLSTEQKDAVVQAFVSSKPRDPSWGACLLAEVPVERPERETIYRAWSAASQNRDGVIDIQTVKQLPNDLAEREARRHLHEVTALKTRPEARIHYAQLLSWDEALAQLGAYLGHPEGDMRGIALTTLLGVAGRLPVKPDRVDEALKLCLGKKFEQDPVRLRMLMALVEWPRQIWDKKHLAIVGQLLRDALDAADLSHATAQTAERLVVRLFFLDGAHGAKWLATLLKERGTIYAPGLGDMLSDAEVEALGPSLMLIANSWASKERESQLWGLTESLGRRIRLVKGLPELLEKTMSQTANATVSWGILQLFYLHLRPRFERCVVEVCRRWVDKGWDAQLAGLIRTVEKLPPEVEDSVETALLRVAYPHQAELLLSAVRHAHAPLLERLIPKALKRDRSFICVPMVWGYLHRKRQDLLEPYLAGEVVTGRFATGKTRWLLPFHDGFFRWNPHQQSLFCGTLRGLYGDDDRDTPSVLWAMDRLYRLAYTSGDALIALCDDKRAAISERAVRTLSRFDAGQGIPKLLACLEDQRARFAIYGLRLALGDMPAMQAVTILRGVSLKKVTVAKEVVRLLGELRSDEAYKLLLSLDQPTLHRDIRIALCRALWDHLHRDETWQILRQAATGPDFILATRIGDIPAERLTVQSDAKLAQVLTLVLARPEPEARRDLLQKAPSLPLRDHSRGFLLACLSRLDSRYYDEVESAMRAILLRAIPSDVPAFEAQLRNTKPNRRALAIVVEQLGAVFDRKTTLHVRLGEAITNVLSSDPLLTTLHLRAMTKLLLPDALWLALQRLAQTKLLDAETILAASDAVQAMPANDLEPLEEQLVQSPHAILRLLGVRALQAAAVKGQGFTTARRQRLERAQQDPDRMVAAAAQLVFPPLQDPPPVEAKKGSLPN